MKIKARISLSFRNDSYTSESIAITITDKNSSIGFCEILLTSEEFTKMLSGMHGVPVRADVRGLDLVGKKHESKSFEFKLPNDANWLNRKDKAISSIDDACPRGWEADTDFNSQDSFFTKKDKEEWARCIIRRWVDK